MLHTVNSIKKANRKYKLYNKNYTMSKTLDFYTIFNTVNFKPKDTYAEKFFCNIYTNFITRWNNSIKPFIDGVIKDDSFYDKQTRPIFIIDEAIYLTALGVDTKNIRLYQIGKSIRMFAIEDMPDNIDYETILSTTYSNVDMEPLTILSIFINIQSFRNKDSVKLDEVLFGFVNKLILSYIDLYLVRLSNVTLNSICVNNKMHNKYSIVVGYDISSCIFIYYYYLTYFMIAQSILNENILESFGLFSNDIELPELFNTTKERNMLIMNNIWDNAKKELSQGCPMDSERMVDTIANMVDICGTIMDKNEVEEIKENKYYLRQEQENEKSDRSVCS